MDSSKASTSDDKENPAGGSQATPLFTTEQAEYVKKFLKKRTYSEMLGVGKNATEMEILHAAICRIRELNPNKNKAPGATKAYKTLMKAYKSCLRQAQLQMEQRRNMGQLENLDFCSHWVYEKMMETSLIFDHGMLEEYIYDDNIPDPNEDLGDHVTSSDETDED